MPAQLRADLRGCAWLVRLLPELAEGPIEPLPAWTLPAAQERRLMVEAVARFLANVAGPIGTLLVLDDLQWADPDALDLLATLARSASEVPVRVLGAYRDTEVQAQDALSVMLADLAHAGLAARRVLGPLASEEAAQLLEGLLGDGDDETRVLRAQVLRRAGCVPFFVVSCAQGLQQDALEERREDAVPWDVAQSVRQRVAALPERARAVLGVAAVVGRVVPSTLLAGAAARPEDEVAAAFDAACRARLLEEQGEEAYQFAHDVIREVVEADLGAARRAMLHRRVAEALEQEPGEPPIEAPQFGRCLVGPGPRGAAAGTPGGGRAGSGVGLDAGAEDALSLR
jgi:predicted ATPase